ncbi:MAG: GIY-YIG nuclease family protein [Lachnospiraceae bacterium]|nr:GIY-YIG nuclease family protein [Lachnospiraceae bacterium]
MTKDVFEKAKRDILSIICKSSKEVTRKTNENTSGVYMVYVDNFSDTQIIPFYIGQTSNFQERYKKHLSELLSLNRLRKNCYIYAMQKESYNGHYRACKIFSYMVDHQCDLNDFHMVVLDEISDEHERLKRENEYINELSAPFLGFNQMNCIVDSINYKYGMRTKEEFLRTVVSDIQKLVYHADYGYWLFNWYLVCGFWGMLEEQEKALIKENEMLVQVMAYKNRLEKIYMQMAVIRRYNHYEGLENAWQICKSTIIDFFAQNKLRSKDKQQLSLKVWLFNFEDDKTELEKYFNRYSERIKTNLLDILSSEHGKELEPIKTRILSNQKKYRELEQEKEVILDQIFSPLIPKEEYTSHPLKTLYENFEFKSVKNGKNVCYINVEYTCFKSDYENDFYPEICKIDYLIVRNGNIYTRSAFIENSLSDFFEYEDIYYYERGIRKGPFNILLVGGVSTHIPVLMEYKNGINEYTLRMYKQEDGLDVFKEIEVLIDDETKIVYTSSGYKNSINRYSRIAEEDNIGIIKRLIRLCK